MTPLVLAKIEELEWERQNLWARMGKTLSDLALGFGILNEDAYDEMAARVQSLGGSLHALWAERRKERAQVGPQGGF